MTEKWLNNNRETIRRIAHRLIATSFYFEVEKVEAGHLETDFHCSGLLIPCLWRSELSSTNEGLGYIRCKFADGSQYLQELGKLLAAQKHPRFSNYCPFFTIVEKDHAAESQKVCETLELYSPVDCLSTIDGGSR